MKKPVPGRLVNSSASGTAKIVLSLDQLIAPRKQPRFKRTRHQDRDNAFSCSQVELRAACAGMLARAEHVRHAGVHRNVRGSAGYILVRNE